MPGLVVNTARMPGFSPSDVVPRILVALAVVCTGALAACGSSPKPRATVTLLMGSAPGSLDPAVATSSQAAEADWLVYTGLLTYTHSGGIGGTHLVPGLASSLPTVSDGGRTYTLSLRTGLVYSDGRPVRASDFAWTLGRSIRLGAGGKRALIASLITGARAYLAGKARNIAGINTDDASGQITIHLVSAYGPFENLLALPALGFVPRGTRLTDQAAAPPPGIGPYEIRHVTRRSFSLVQNPRWTQMGIQEIPAGHVDVRVEISPQVQANALAVLHDAADVFDWTDPVPTSVTSQISPRSTRYSRRAMNQTDYVLFNTARRPFSSQLAREAVITALDENAINELAPVSLIGGCYFLPPDMVGHPTAPCPYAKPSAGGDLPKAQALVQESGTAGARVAVWSDSSSPDVELTTYYAQLLNRLGFRAKQAVVASPSSVPAGAQSRLAAAIQDLPNPSDFYRPLVPTLVRAGELDSAAAQDRQLVDQLTALGSVPAGNLAVVESDWGTLDEYVAQQAYVAILGYATFPVFTSHRVDQRAVVLHPVYGLDWSSFRLRQ
jgi:peptide/nickel transport system substrate-binding protein